ncbi:acetate/propionate family kinase [Thiohalophilus thiocyanatoxydans]|uniref:Acetate kinase n=1 Tax=Thiohalophilus thiocyanatoxydans TaxID=381308 RepID=A0A4V6QBV8_9GAMM|nr:acetate/propionate family kinase [Thiohalophilus thiocyanatoxydans]TDY00595.1 acetate kinase [Thiohalophilus thiocyanatoxydans]
MFLTINSGSSSLRLAAYRREGGELQQLATARHETEAGACDELLRQFIDEHNLQDVRGVVHRVVHGGSYFSDACHIDTEVESRIEALAPLAPLHNPPALALIRTARKLLPQETAHVAVFDTGFFHSMPGRAARYALPSDLSCDHEPRRYGFHGLAHQAMWQAWLRHESGHSKTRLITLQLGAGCSISAIRGGKPLDTSMGFSPLEGLVMATRSGDLDPGLLLYLQHQQGMTPEQLDNLLNRHSGLLGISGLSGDMRDLLDSTEPRAQQAVDLYCYRAAKYIGAYLAVLGGADGIVFGGGVGEHAPPIRARILGYLGWAGIDLDPDANQATLGEAGRISRSDSRIAAWVLPVDEARLMAEQAWQLLDT